MDTGLEYRLMCLRATELQENWIPSKGDYMVAKASYCYRKSKCTEDVPCNDCLKSSNIYVVSAQFDYHESVGGTHWYFGGSNCGRGHVNYGNSTQCYVMANERYESKDKDHTVYAVKEHLWLPRQDQIQQMFWNGLTDIYKVRHFLRWSKKASFNYYATSLEELWLMCYMEEVYKKKWNKISNIKEWELIPSVN